jgi:hypothetical protein
VADTATLGKNIKLKVDQEAAAAEAETPDEETVEPTPAPDADPGGDEEAEAEEPTPEPEPQASSQDPRKQFDRAFKAFGDKLLRIFGVDELTPAPHPGVVGFMLPGFAEPMAHENYKRCDTCNGLGKVLTGAITGDQAKDWHVCPDSRCKGNGYWVKQAPAEATPLTGPLAVQATPAGNGEWGEAPAWMGDPSLTAGV